MVNQTVKKVEEVTAHFNGRDPIAEAQVRMKSMTNDELRKLVLIASNRIGLLMKGDDYETPIEAAIYLGTGIDSVMSAYDSAIMQIRATTDDIGTA